MAAEATTYPQLDLLVPPPGPRWRRNLIGAALVLSAVLVSGLWFTGTATPHTHGSYIAAWGGPGPVHITLSVHNDSRVSIEIIDGPRSRPGLDPVGYTVSRSDLDVERLPADDRSPFPVRIAPNDRVLLTVWYDPTDCEAIEAIGSDDHAVDLQMEIADGPFSLVTRTREIPNHVGFSLAEGSQPSTIRPVSWAAAVAAAPCGLDAT